MLFPEFQIKHTQLTYTHFGIYASLRYLHVHLVAISIFISYMYDRIVLTRVMH